MKFINRNMMIKEIKLIMIRDQARLKESSRMLLVSVRSRRVLLEYLLIGLIVPREVALQELILMGW